jgi:hypothetical protein
MGNVGPDQTGYVTYETEQALLSTVLRASWWCVRAYGPPAGNQRWKFLMFNCTHTSKTYW